MGDRTVTPPDLGMLLLFSMRYALGRRSTAPSDVSDVIRRYWRETDDAHRALLLRDLREAVGRGALGDACDETTWRVLLAWMEVAGG